MLEGRCHAVHFGFVQAVPRGFIAPLRDSLADLFCYVARFAVVQIEIPRHLHCQRERGRVVVFVDPGAENARLDVGRHRVEVVSGRQAPARLAFVQKAVIAQVVVGVGDQYVENQPPPQRFHVGLRRGAVLAQRVNNFQIASGFIVFRSEHAHRGEERDTPFAVAVESSQEEHRLAGDVFDTRLGNGDARFLREGQCDRLPDPPC